jgi:hypothetical protein
MDNSEKEYDEVEEIIQYVSEENPDALMFRDPDFYKAIVGYYYNEMDLPVLVYKYDKMVECLAAEYDDSEDPYIDAMEWVNYNTLRTLPYMDSKGRPIIIY